MAEAANPPSPREAAPEAPRTPRPFTPEEAASLITGPIEPVRRTIAYRLALAAAALAMILLPAVYVAIVAGVAVAVGWHLVRHTSWFDIDGLRGFAAVIPLLAYAAPAIAGGVVILFMVKPLFNRRSGEYRRLSLDPAAEPALFALVGSICRAIGAPPPGGIDVTLEANAAATRLRGASARSGNRLVLRIGLPLVAGMTVNQFVGVLAHEYGHFTQGAGTGFWVIIERINAWIAHVALQRDEWDEKLRKLSQESVLWYLFMLPRGGVWIARRILLGLLWASGAISSHLSRQLEYDADLHESRLVGAEAFEAAILRLLRLSMVEETVWDNLGERRNEGALPESMPDMIVFLADRFTPEGETRLATLLGENRLNLFSSHPPFAERIARAKADGATPKCVCEEPARRLFAQFRGLCRDVSLEAYQEAFGGTVAADELVPIETIAVDTRAHDEGELAFNRDIGPRATPHVKIPGSGGPLDASPEECLATLRRAGARLRAEPPVSDEEFAEAMKVLPNFRHTTVLRMIVGIGWTCTVPQFSEPITTVEAVETYRLVLWRVFSAATFSHRRRLHTVDRRLRAALGWLASTSHTAGPIDAALRAEASRLSAALAALAERRQDCAALEADCHAIEYWFQQTADGDDLTAIRDVVADHVRSTSARIDAIGQALTGERFPFNHTALDPSIGDYLLPGRTSEDRPELVLLRGRIVCHRYSHLVHRCLGRLLVLADAVEAATGVELSPTD